MRLVVTGKDGQVTRALQALEQAELKVIAVGRPELDLGRPETVLAALEKAKPDVIVSAAAYTAVDKAESEPETAFAINRDGAKAVAKAASVLGVPVIHLSTDYVFDGSKSSPYLEDDRVGPVSVYGRSKLEGEQMVAAATPNHVILRTAWVYSTFGNNFVRTMLKLGATREELRVVCDQYGCPTSAHDIADAIVEVARKLSVDGKPELRGVFHLAGAGETNWSAFARYILAASEKKTGKHVIVHDIPTTEYPTPAKRPANSRLCCDRLEAEYGIRLPDWRKSTDLVVETLLSRTGDAA